MNKILLAIVFKEGHASSHVRLLQYRELFAEKGVDLKVHYAATPFSALAANSFYRYQNLGGFIERVSCTLLGKFERICRMAFSRFRMFKIQRTSGQLTAVFYQSLTPSFTELLFFKKARIPIIYDLDDACYLHDSMVDATIREAFCVIVGSESLYGYAQPLNPNTIMIPSAVPIDIFPKVIPSENRSLTLGWIGGGSTVKYLEPLIKPLARLWRIRQDIRLLIAGANVMPANFAALEMPIHHISTYNADILPEIVRRLDVGLYPLTNGEWERGKTALKAMVYGAGWRPCVASPVGEVRRLFLHDKNILFAASEDDWFYCILHLLDNPKDRKRIGMSARERVCQGFIREQCFMRIWEKVLDPVFFKR